MADIIWYVFLFGVVALLVVGGIWVLRSVLNGTSPRAAIFGPKAEPRLSVVEHAYVDGRRRLVLIRRDDTEHLIMTGGPVDVVIETGIGQRRVRPEVVDRLAPAPVFTRAPRTAGSGGGAVEKVAK